MGRRAAVKSQQAKNAAAIAAAEARADEADKKAGKKTRKKGPPKSKLRPKPKGNKTAASELEEPDELDDEIPDAQEAEINNILIDWANDLNLTWTLIGAIEDDKETSASLFPGVGGISRDGGKPKSHFYYKLAQSCFEEHEKYRDAFAKDTIPKKQRAWSNKIKNRLKTLVTKCREHIAEMGETCAGIKNTEEIVPGTPLANKWELIEASGSPWHWRIRELIAARPNLQPVGLGNNDTEIDPSILIPSHDDEDNRSSAPDDTTDLPDEFTDPVIDLAGSDSDNSLLSIPTLAASVKRKREEDVKTPAPETKPVKKTKPQPPTSVPAVPVVAVKKATSAKERFAATVLAEEETAQRALRLKRERNAGKKEVMLAKIQMETDMEQEHLFRMAQIRPQPSQAGPSSLPFDDGSISHRSSPYSLFDNLPTLRNPSADDQDGLGQSTYTGFGFGDHQSF
ncbi:hypothetical protein DFH09DRAFT_1495152 [Mycena vulgaris]|nr:hypothetical protein DFH09DRAFT_1495152 [Mycena vulgaris]